MKCVSAGGQFGRFELTLLLGFRRMEAMTKHRSHSAGFKRQVASESIPGETLHALSKRHEVSRQMVRIVGKFEAGALDDDVQAADLLQEHEAKIAALERMVGRQAPEIEGLNGALKHAPRPRRRGERRAFDCAVWPGPRAAGVEHAAGWRDDRARHVASQNTGRPFDPDFNQGFGRQHCGGLWRRASNVSNGRPQVSHADDKWDVACAEVHAATAPRGWPSAPTSARKEPVAGIGALADG